MRLKNVKGAKEIIDSSPYIIKNPKEYKGKFKKLFQNSNEIHLEIGMGDWLLYNSLHNKLETGNDHFCLFPGAGHFRLASSYPDE